MKTPDFDTSNDMIDGLPMEAYDLYSFLETYQDEESSDKETHLISYYDRQYKVGHCGSFIVPDKRYRHFLSLYAKALNAGVKMYIVEKPKAFGPLILKLNFQEHFENSHRVYSTEDLKTIVYHYARIAKECLVIKSAQLDAYVMETKRPILYAGTYCDSVHVVFPRAICMTDAQSLVRQKFVEYATDHGLFESISAESIDKIVDADVIKYGSWAMYGSTTGKALKPNLITHVYQLADKNVYETWLPAKNTADDINYFVKMNSVRNCEESDIIALRAKYRESALASMVDKQQQDADNACYDLHMTFEEVRESINENVLEDSDYEQAQYFVSLLSSKRASNYHTWIQVGRCLHNLDNRLYTDWLNFSQKTTRDNYSEDICFREWNNMEPNNFTMASLHFFARSDSKVVYEDYISKRASRKLGTAVQCGNPGPVWDYISEKYPFRFVCADSTRNIWYEFARHRWLLMNGTASLFKTIATDVKTEVNKLIRIYKTKSMDEEENKGNHEANEKKAVTLKGKLEKASFIREIIDYGKNMVCRDNFINDLDSNVNLICFTNGVYDLEVGIFRDGCPDDMISLHTKYPYMPYNPNDRIYMEINSFFEQIMPDPAVRQYLLTALAISISGSIEEQKFYIFTGSGSNGKTRLMMLMSDVLGELYKTMDINVLVGKGNKECKASPEVADKKGIRVCPLNEPGHDDKLNASLMKTFSGDEPIAPRHLFQANIYFVPQFTCFLICNDTPEIDTDDGGTWRRMVVIDFVAKFLNKSDVENPASFKLGPNQYWIDKTLKTRMKKWASPMMALLIKIYGEYRENGGYVTPKPIIERTIRYRRECDKYQDFFYDYIDKTVDSSKFVSLETLYSGFRNWWRINGFHGNHPSRKVFTNYLRLKMDGYDSVKHQLHGYTLKVLELED